MRNLDSAPFVTIHGPDGVGKTTVGRNVAKTLSRLGMPAVFFDDWRTENGWSNPFSNQALKQELGNTSRGFIALQAAKAAMDSIVITELTDTGVTVIKDRGILDVRADLQYRGFDPKECAGPLIREPDFAVLLSVSEENRLSRLKVKSDVHPDDYQPNLPGNRLYEMTTSLREQVEMLPPKEGFIINTDNMQLDEVVTAITSVLSETVSL